MSETTLLNLEARTSRPAEFGRDALVVCDNLVRIYQTGHIEVQALQGLDLLVDPGEMVAVVGASGSGKSTLLNVLAGIDAPTAGRVRVGEWNLARLNRADRVAYRRSMVGFVWQQSARNLVPYLTAEQNVTLPQALAGRPGRSRRRRAAELLDLLNVGPCARRRPHELSGGEQQRVAIAVALANAPQVLLTDEPTGELDTATSHEVFAALRHVNTELGATVLVVTHDPNVSGQVARTVAIRDGRTSTEVLRRHDVDADGTGRVVAEEYAVMDRAGRVQVPADYREALALTRRVRLALEADHVSLWPDRRDDR
jgi:ABC-type lipoprotein export system ATPase subunit